MKRLSASYHENVAHLKGLLRTEESFDMIVRTLSIGKDELTLFYIDGFVKDGEMQRIMQYFLGLKGLGEGEGAAKAFAATHVPYVEVDCIDDVDQLLLMVLSGATVMLGSTFGDHAIVIDARTYPARSTEEPNTDRVIQGAHDGFVETLIFNTALIRRRLRDPRLTIKYLNLGGASKTDVALCYVDGVADKRYLERLTEKLASLKPQSLTTGTQGLTELLIPRRWYNPFPKVRTLERPDAAAACLTEGRILLLCDTSPQVMVLPTSYFDFLQETDDYYMPPLTGSYLRLLRHMVFLLSLVITPTWYLLIQYKDILPQTLLFIVPKDTGPFPLLLQLILVELAIDGLKLASVNTPDALTNSLSVIGGLLLGEFAINLGWLSEAVIFYMAVVAIAAFSQQSAELGYAFKFLRVLTLILTALFGWVGYILGLLTVVLCLFTNRTLSGSHGYMYPVIPFNRKAFGRLFIRLPKARVEKPCGHGATEEKNNTFAGDTTEKK